MKALAGQYYSGEILAPDINDREAFQDVDVIIHPGAVNLDSVGLIGEWQEILIDWELDPGSASTFAGRVEAFTSA